MEEVVRVLGLESLKIRLEAMFDLLLHRLDQLVSILREIKEVLDGKNPWDGPIAGGPSDADD